MSAQFGMVPCPTCKGKGCGQCGEGYVHPKAANLGKPCGYTCAQGHAHCHSPGNRHHHAEGKMFNEYGLVQNCLECARDGRAVFAFTAPKVAREQAAKEQGMAAAAANTDTWQDRARWYFLALPLGTQVTSDDLTDAIGVPPSQGAVGAAFNAAARKGLIRQVGSTLSEREGRHRSRVMVWERT